MQYIHCHWSIYIRVYKYKLHTSPFIRICIALGIYRQISSGFCTLVLYCARRAMPYVWAGVPGRPANCANHPTICDACARSPSGIVFNIPCEIWKSVVEPRKLFDACTNWPPSKRCMWIMCVVDTTSGYSILLCSYVCVSILWPLYIYSPACVPCCSLERSLVASRVRPIRNVCSRLRVPWRIAAVHTRTSEPFMRNECFFSLSRCECMLQHAVYANGATVYTNTNVIDEYLLCFAEINHFLYEPITDNVQYGNSCEYRTARDARMFDYILYIS